MAIPAPTYAAVGSSAGRHHALTPTTRVLSGTPTATGSGTITIRATNSEGMADWTVDYNTSRIPRSSRLLLTTRATCRPWTVGTMRLARHHGTGRYWQPRPDLCGSRGLSAGQASAFDPTTRVLSGTPTATGSGTNHDPSDELGRYGRLDGRPTPQLLPLQPRSFADDTGDAQSWMQNDAITPLTVPAATGNPAPTYAVEGSLPVGIAFDTTTRVLSGTPTATGSGTITIRATNSEGMADWTVDYTTVAALAAPSFTDNTGDAQTWTVWDAITAITVPAASGNPAPTYAAVGTLPAGIGFDTTTRVLSGTPTATGFGTITIRASNSEGTADWTVDYNTAAALAAPVFADDTGDAQTWTLNQAIAPLTVPAATGNPPRQLMRL